jgi:hypothetical protein
MNADNKLPAVFSLRACAQSPPSLGPKPLLGRDRLIPLPSHGKPQPSRGLDVNARC